MTLGGFALAVGILVDDATVEIENINRNLAQGKEIQQAILDGAAQIAVPAFVSTLSICIVFVPMFFLTGVARYLFVPLAEAVVFAMLSSYFLSRTLVPTMARFLLRAHRTRRAARLRRTPSARLQRRFEERFERLREGYRRLLEARHGAAGTLRRGLPRVLRRAPRRSCSPGSGATSSRRSTAARSSCTSARGPEPASRRPPVSATASTAPSAR